MEEFLTYRRNRREAQKLDASDRYAALVARVVGGERPPDTEVDFILAKAGKTDEDLAADVRRVVH